MQGRTCETAGRVQWNSDVTASSACETQARFSTNGSPGVHGMELARLGLVVAVMQSLTKKLPCADACLPVHT